jgi:Ca2+-binding RTX toxin-like protein
MNMLKVISPHGPLLGRLVARFANQSYTTRPICSSCPKEPMNRHCLEPLEPRRLLSTITLLNNRVTIVGNQNSPNRIVVGYSPGMRYIVCVVNGVTTDFKRNDVGGVYIFGGNDNDYLAISQARAPFDKGVRIMGEGGNDTLIGGNENDIIYGGSGNDYISLGLGDDIAVAQGGNDRILGGNATKTIFGGTGDDVIEMGASHGYIFPNQGNDSILDSDGAQFEILGQGGNDTITSNGEDTIWAGGGNDIIHGGKEVHQSEISGLNKIMSELMPIEPTIPPGST